MKRFPFERRVSVSEASGRSHGPRSAPAYPGAGFNITRDRRLASGETVPDEPSLRSRRQNYLNPASIGNKRQAADGAKPAPRKRLRRATSGRIRTAAPPMRPASQPRASFAALPLTLLGIIAGGRIRDLELQSSCRLATLFGARITHFRTATGRRIATPRPPGCGEPYRAQAIPCRLCYNSRA